MIYKYMIEKRSPSYFGTMILGNVWDEDILATVRKRVAYKNKVEGTNYRVCLMPRLGKNNPNAYKYRRGGCMRNGHQMIRKADAKTADIYIYERR